MHGTKTNKRYRLLRRKPGGLSRLGAETLDRAVDWFGTWLARLYWTLSLVVGPEHSSRLGRQIMRAVGPHLRPARHVRRNIEIAFPQKTPEELDALSREIWGNFGAVMTEYAHLGRISDERLEIVDQDKIRRADKPAIFVTAHFGNWELAAAAGRGLTTPLAVLFNPMPNPSLHRQLQKRRQALGAGFVDRNNSVRELLRLLAGGTSIGMVVDQRVDSGREVPFFGHPAATSMVPARLAVKHDYDLVPVRVDRLPRTRFRVTFHDPLRPSDDAADRDSKALDLTRQINECFEEWITAEPEQWFCFKRRWPRKKESLGAAVKTSAADSPARQSAPRPATGAGPHPQETWAAPGG